MNARLASTVLTATMTLLFLSGCANLHKQTVPLYEAPAYYNYLQADFEAYVDISRSWLSRHREFISDNQTLELDMNAPFILKAAQPSSKAILLIHGLGDSPYYFSDLGRSLQQQGFDVFVLLLPGHGSKPSDLLLPRYQDWQQIVDVYSNQLKARYPEFWLGGFSTGANLATIHTLEQGGISGLLLFSPGFQSHIPFLEKLSPLVASIWDWAWITREDNLARYSSAPINATIAYSDSASTVRARLKQQQLDIPTYIVMSEADSVIDPQATIELFKERFTHPANRMTLYGEMPVEQEKILVKSMRLPEYQISTGSHMSPLFAPDNPYYGRKGQKRMCRNGLNSTEKQRCEQGDAVWFSAWGYSEEDKIHARLTWNPYYQEMLEQISHFTRLTQPAPPNQSLSLKMQARQDFPHL